MRPSPSEEGVKAFALCPWFVPTKMVTDEPEYKGLTIEESKRKVAQEIHKGQGLYRKFMGLTRTLIVEEVGEALMHSLKRDADGAAYLSWAAP